MNTLLPCQNRSCTITRGLFLISAVLLLTASMLLAQESITLVNPSFEQPGVEETDWANIPGWSIDTPPGNAGVGNNPGIATEGEWIAWLRSDDDALWQLTDYTIQEADSITLMADVRNSWQTTVFDLILYYDDNGTRVALATTTPDFEGFVDDTLTTFVVTFSASSLPDAIGKRVGVSVDNTSASESYIEMDNFRLSVSPVTTAVERATQLPTSFALEQNYPNPFNPETVIQYQMEETGRVQLEIYDLLGHKVRTLIDASQPAGTHSVRWNALDDGGNRVPSGVYFYRLTVLAQDGGRDFTTSRKMLLMQ